MARNQNDLREEVAVFATETMAADGCFCSLAFYVRQAVISLRLALPIVRVFGMGSPPSRLRRFGAWLAEPKLVRRQIEARLRVATQRYGAASFACIYERRMASGGPPSLLCSYGGHPSPAGS
jgi:hypothetical protein